MRYYEKVQKTMEDNELRGIQCNKCGEIFEPNYGNIIHEINISDGYSSKFTSPFKFDICEKCLIKFLKEFLLVPDNFMNDFAGVPPYATDHELHQKLFNEWKKTEKWNYEDNPYRDAWMSKEEFINIEDDEKFYEELENIKTLKPACIKGFKN